MELQSRGQLLCVLSVALYARVILSRFTDERESSKGVDQEPAEPRALALSFVPHAVHAVVPLPSSDEREAVDSGHQAVLDGADAVLVERPRRSRDCGREVRIFLAVGQLGSF